MNIQQVGHSFLHHCGTQNAPSLADLFHQNFLFDDVENPVHYQAHAAPALGMHQYLQRRMCRTPSSLLGQFGHFHRGTDIDQRHDPSAILNHLCDPDRSTALRGNSSSRATKESGTAIRPLCPIWNSSSVCRFPPAFSSAVLSCSFTIRCAAPPITRARWARPTGSRIRATLPSPIMV